MLKSINKILISILLLSLVSCGDSPLLNHEDESSSPQGNIDSISSSNASFSVEGSQYQVRINWTKGPYSSPAKESKVLISLLNPAGELVDLPVGYHLELWGYMPSMGHGTAYDGYIDHMGLGTYMNFELFFNMPGDWEINIEVKKGTTTTISTVKYSFDII